MEHAFGLEIPEGLEDVCDPRQLALIVYDMQVGILSQIATASAVTTKVATVLDAARAGGFRVFFTRHVSLPNELAGSSRSLLRAIRRWSWTS